MDTQTELLKLDTAEPTQTEQKPSKFFTEYYGSAMLILMAGLLAGGFFFLRPIITDIKETNAMTRQQIQTTEAERAYLASLESSVAAAQSISPSVLEDVKKILPDAQNNPLVLLQLSDSAKRNQVRLDAVTFTEKGTKPAASPGVVPATSSTSATTLQPVDISLTVHARDYQQIKRFLVDLESNIRLMDISALSSSAATADGVAYMIQLKTYTFSSTVRGLVIAPARP